MLEPQLPPNDFAARLQARIAWLEKQNAALRQEQVQLRQSEARYRQVVENAPLSIVFISADGCLVEGNRAFEQMYGMTSAQLTEQNFNIFTDPQLVENGTLPYMQRALAGETVIEPPTCYDASQTVEGGNFSRGQGHYFPIRDQLGRVQEIVEMCLDVTALYEAQQALLHAEQERSQALKRHNAELQQALDCLAESEHGYRTLFELSNEGIYRFGFEQPVPTSLPVEEQLDLALQHYRFVEANETFFAQMGLSLNQLRDFTLSNFHGDSAENRQVNRAILTNGYQIRNAETDELDALGRRKYFLNNVVCNVRDGYVWGGWCTQTDITELREAQQALLQAEQARSAELEQANNALQSTVAALADRCDLDGFIGEVLHTISREFASPLVEYWTILGADTAEVHTWLCANQLFSRQHNHEHPGRGGIRLLPFINFEDFTRSDQVLVFEEPVPAYSLALGQVICPTEWYAARGASKHFNFRLQVGSLNIGSISVWLPPEQQLTDDQLRLGQALSHQTALAIQLTQLAEEAKQAAIAREQELAAQERAAELVKANEALRQTVDVLATEADLDHFLGHVLKVVADQLDAPLTEYWFHPEPDNIAYVGLTYWQGQILMPEQQPGHPGAIGFPVLPELIGQESLHHRRGHFVVEDLRTSSLHAKVAAEYGIDAGAWYETYGVSRHLNVPLILGDKTIGALIVFLPGDRHFTSQQIELAYALAQQVTLAIQLTRLAEEAKLAAIAREQELAAQERAAELAKANEALQQTIDALGCVSEFDEFVPAVLKIVARTFGANVCGYYEHPDETIYLRYWFSNGTVLSAMELQLLDPAQHPTLCKLAEGFTVSPEHLNGATVRNRTRPLVLDHRTMTATPDLHAFAVAQGWDFELNQPLVVDGEAEGAIVIYRAAHQPFTEPEIALVETLAKPLALALQAKRLATQTRERAVEAVIAREQEKAALSRAVELAKANEALKRSLDVLAADSDLNQFIGHVLKTVAEQLDAPVVEYWSTSNNVAYLELTCWQGEVLNREQLTDHLHRQVVAIPPELAAHKAVRQHQRHSIVDDLLNDPLHVHLYSALKCDLEAWCNQHKVRRELNVPLQLGVNTIGVLCVYVPAERSFTQQQIELSYALAQQVTLALRLTQLAEEAKLAAITREQELAAQERAAELAKANEALKRSLTLLANEPSLDKFLGYVLQTIADRLGDRSGAVYLYSEPHHTTLLHLNYENGHLQQGDLITHPAATLPHPPQAWDDQYLPLLRQNQLLIHHACEFDSPAYAPYRQHNFDRGIQTLLIVPMLFGDQLLGSLTLRSTHHRDYTPEELELARALAQQATLAVQLTQLAEQRRQTAVLEERNRMARDIHDTLAQSFTGIILQLEATKSLPNSHCLDIHTSLDCIGELARLGLAEARRSVRALRLEALETTNFFTALRRLLHQITNGTSIHATLAIEGTAQPLPPNLEENLLRIAQEALTNAIRHGHARTITLQLLFEPTTVHLHITDDGNGFAPHSIVFSGFGLLGMQERTQQISGQFHLVSQPGQGTEITVSVPI